MKRIAGGTICVALSLFALLTGCAAGGKSASAGGGEAGGTGGAGAQAAAASAAEAAAKEASAREASKAAALAESEGKAAVVVGLAASKDLNTFNNQPHTVVLVFYQLSDPNVFKQFTETPEGLAKLLAGESFDASVLSRRRIVVQPGQFQALTLPLVDRATYLGVVGGFYSMRGETASRLIPVELKKKGMWRWKSIEPMSVDLELARDGFVQ